VCRAKKAESRRVKRDWEIIADNLSKAGWSWGCVSAIDSNGRTIWIVDAHRDDGRRFIVQLCGTLEEAHKVIDKQWHGTRLSKEMSPSLSQKAKGGLKAFNKYFSSQNLVTSIRQNFAHHFDSEILKGRLCTCPPPKAAPAPRSANGESASAICLKDFKHPKLTLGVKKTKSQ